MLHESKHSQIYTIPWGIVAAAVIGGVSFALVASVVVYKCYTSRRPRSRPLSSAIRQAHHDVTADKKTPRGSVSSSTQYTPYTGKRHSSQGLILPNDERDMTVPPARMTRSPSMEKPLDPSTIRAAVYTLNEKQGNAKDECLREKGIDEEKMPKLGSLFFNVAYDGPKSALMVSILKMCDLPARNSNQETSDPYVKLQLLPDKRHKVKTRVLRKTLNPVYDEIFTFYGVDYNQLTSITLHFVVLSFDRFSRDDVIGEVMYPLYSVENLTFDGKEQSLCKEIAPRNLKMQKVGRGEMLVSLCYTPAVNRLTVVVLKARNLPRMDVSGCSDPYVKIYLLYNGQRIAKKKTQVKKRCLDPVYNQSFLFDVPRNEGLQNISLELQVLDWDRVTKNEVIGRIEIGAPLSGMAGKHWNEVMNCPRKQIAEWHTLHD